MYMMNCINLPLCFITFDDVAVGCSKVSSENQQYCTPRRLSDFLAALKPFVVLAVPRRLNDITAKFLFVPFCNQDVNLP